VNPDTTLYTRKAAKSRRGARETMGRQSTAPGDPGELGRQADAALWEAIALEHRLQRR